MKLAALFKPLNEEMTPIPAELSEIVKVFSKDRAAKAMQALWGKDRLSWHGKAFWENGEMADWYSNMIREAQNILDGDDVECKFEAVINILNEPHHIEFDLKLNDHSEVYLGYDPVMDELVLGFDCWADEEAFNQDWDEEFEKAVGEEFDMENDEHSRAYHEAYKEFKDAAFIGAAVRFESESPHFTPHELTPGGFYQGSKKHLGDLYDIRLD